MSVETQCLTPLESASGSRQQDQNVSALVRHDDVRKSVVVQIAEGDPRGTRGRPHVLHRLDISSATIVKNGHGPTVTDDVRRQDVLHPVFIEVGKTKSDGLTIGDETTRCGEPTGSVSEQHAYIGAKVIRDHRIEHAVIIDVLQSNRAWR